MTRLFISHASEDKDAIARPLANRLLNLGYTVWFDEFTLKLGDSLRKEIDRGLSQCDYGIVILSPNFFVKSWPQSELDGLFTKEYPEKKVILPIWHNIDADEVKRFSPILAGRLAVKSSEGFETIVKKITEAVDAIPSYFEIDQWIAAQKRIFPLGIPAHCEWIGLDEIANCLNVVAHANMNHMMFPTGGGLDLENATYSSEHGCIELDNGGVYQIIKPKKLTFDSFPPYYSMSYFRLEVDNLEPCGMHEPLNPRSIEESPNFGYRENLREIGAANYYSYDLWEREEWINPETEVDEQLPPSTRHISRWFKGVFLIVPKSGIYNSISETYDGRHDKWSEKDLREFHEQIIIALKEKGKDPDTYAKVELPAWRKPYDD